MLFTSSKHGLLMSWKCNSDLVPIWANSSQLRNGRASDLRAYFNSKKRQNGRSWGSDFSMNMCIRHCKYQCFMKKLAEKKGGYSSPQSSISTLMIHRTAPVVDGRIARWWRKSRASGANMPALAPCWVAGLRPCHLWKCQHDRIITPDVSLESQTFGPPLLPLFFFNVVVHVPIHPHFPKLQNHVPYSGCRCRLKHVSLLDEAPETLSWLTQ